MINKYPIEREFLIKAKSLADAARSAEQSIIDRITYIVTTILNKWDLKLETWYFADAQEGEVGNLWHHYNEKEITPLIFASGPRGMELPFFNEKGEKWNLKDSFPSRWLFEEFEQELLSGKKKWEALDQERQEKIASLSKKKRALINRAKKKLSKEELAALKDIL